MARALKDTKLDSRTARLKLSVQQEPHWRQLAPGRFVEYRQLNGKPGRWIARLRDPAHGFTSFRFKSLGVADDQPEPQADSLALTFAQAADFRAGAGTGARVVLRAAEPEAGGGTEAGPLGG
jgi:hypothetical protein